jgi:hypothetical protein
MYYTNQYVTKQNHNVFRKLKKEPYLENEM